MTRPVTKLAVTAAVLTLAAIPATANAQSTGKPVDERTGPVAYANVAALAIGDDGAGGSVISETQRSPLMPGTSRLAQSRSLLPATEGEREAAGGNYRVNLGAYQEGHSPYPAGVPSRGHNVTATLRDTHVPVAEARANYAVRDLPSGQTVVAFQNARSTAECAAPDALTTEATADRLWLLDKGGELAPVDLPARDQRITRLNLPFGPPIREREASPAETVSDVVVSRVTAYDQLLRQDKWRDGDVTTAAGWRVRIVTHLKDAEGRDLRDVTTTFVLGGVSCSLPGGFTAVDPAAKERKEPAVPVKIPAGPHAAEGGDGGVWGFGLLGGGLVLGAAALFVARRRPAKAEG